MEPTVALNEPGREPEAAPRPPATPLASAPGALVVTRDGDLLHVVVEASAGLSAAPAQIRFDVAGLSRALGSSPFAVIVLDDEVLTESDRTWAIELIRRRASGSTIVFVGPSGSPSIERTVRLHGVAHYVEKPLAVDELRAQIRGLLRILPRPPRDARTSE